MKIGIISMNAHTWALNFASPLHSYAFQQFLADNGIDSTIIDYNHCREFDSKYPLFYYIEHPRQNEKQQKKILLKWKNLFFERAERFEKFEHFINTYYKKTDICYTDKTIETDDPGFDCYICATDVIWKYISPNGFCRAFFLASKAFEGKKKIAYAASRGANGYTKEQGMTFFDYISDIDFISVREKSLQNYITENSDLPVKHVVDPVFLREKEFYQNLAIAPPPLADKKGYVLIYICMERSTDVVKNAIEFAKARDLEVIELSEWPKDADIVKGHHHKVIYNIGIEEWLGYMQGAECIFTNSFHACCFSIIFQKQFFAGKRTGDKIDSLLEMFNLSDRRITEFNTEYIENAQDIDFKQVNTLRQKYVKESADFILNAIHTLEKAEHQNHRDLVHEDVYNTEIETDTPEQTETPENSTAGAAQTETKPVEAPKAAEKAAGNAADEKKPKKKNSKFKSLLRRMKRIFK